MWWMVIALLVVWTAGCSSTQDEPLSSHDIAGTVLLETYEIDLRWDYSLRGTYIDGDGLVWSYDRTGAPWYPEKLKKGVFTAKDMLSKHKNAVQIGTVDRPLLLDMAQMIQPASRGKVVKMAGQGDGAGTVEVAYIYDKSDATYTEVILAGSGDRAATNSASEAQVLLDYMREVNALVRPRQP
ncbi:MAG: hypothetical protein ACRERC_00720 [Candidatus Binatia bacterium]